MKTRRGFVLVFLAVCTVLLFYGSASGDTVGTPISVGTVPAQEQLRPPVDSRLLVSNEGTFGACPYPSGTVSMLNTATNAVTTIGVGVNPGPIRFTPDGSKAYVVNQSDCDANGTVTVINVASASVLTTVAVGKLPVTLSVASDGSKVYVANKGASSNSISVICTGLVSAVCSSTDMVIGTINLDPSVGIQPHTMSKNKSGSELWVAEEDCPAVQGCTSGNVAVISTSTDTVIKNITVGPTAGSIQFTPDGSRAYVATRGNGSIGIPPTVVDINSSTHAVTNTITITPPGFPTDAAPHAMRVTPDNSKLYVVNKFANNVAVICTGMMPAVCSPADSLLTYVPVGDTPVRVEITDNGGRVYVLNESPTLTNGSVSVICTGLLPCGGPATDSVMLTSTLGDAPVDMELSCVTNKVYASNSGSNSVSVVTMTGAALCSGVDWDGDGIPNTSDNCPNWYNPSQALPNWAVPVGDSDCDGFPDSVSIAPPNALSSEAHMRTDPLRHCAVTPGRNDEPPPDAWPVDFDDNQAANGSDLLTFAPVFGKVMGNLGYDTRWDINNSNSINGSDLLKFAPFFGKTCA